ncbi:uncharacterized protein LOC122193909 [Lagopus leucura]|uniref:uncharacterized protein LOC122193909 n=1 Tax=Lagopus leucura TaxID=30410 RepID=UPI001C67F6F5|nr:uncharacterized protein LOC122193909 [Lagopus leucura]
MTARPRTQSTPPAVPAPFGGLTNGRAEGAAADAGPPRWRWRRRDGGAARFRAGKAAFRRPPPRASGTPGGQGKAARAHRRRPRPSPVRIQLSSEAEPSRPPSLRRGAAGLREAAADRERRDPPGVRERLLAEPGSPERERSHGSTRVRARHGVRPGPSLLARPFSIWLQAVQSSPRRQRMPPSALSDAISPATRAGGGRAEAVRKRCGAARGSERRLDLYRNGWFSPNHRARPHGNNSPQGHRVTAAQPLAVPAPGQAPVPEVLTVSVTVEPGAGATNLESPVSILQLLEPGAAVALAAHDCPTLCPLPWWGGSPLVPIVVCHEDGTRTVLNSVPPPEETACDIGVAQPCRAAIIFVCGFGQPASGVTAMRGGQKDPLGTLRWNCGHRDQLEDVLGKWGHRITVSQPQSWGHPVSRLRAVVSPTASHHEVGMPVSPVWCHTPKLGTPSRLPGSVASQSCGPPPFSHHEVWDTRLGPHLCPPPQTTLFSWGGGDTPYFGNAGLFFANRGLGNTAPHPMSVMKGRVAAVGLHASHRG